MDQQTKIADLTVAEFRELMAGCFREAATLEQARKWQGYFPGRHICAEEQNLQTTDIASHHRTRIGMHSNE